MRDRLDCRYPVSSDPRGLGPAGTPLRRTAGETACVLTGSREHQEGGVGVPVEGAQVRFTLAEQRFNLVGGTVAPTYPDHLWWVAAHKAQLMKVRILGDDREALRRRILPDGIVVGAAKPNVPLSGNASARAGTSRCERFWSKSSFTLAGSQGGVALDPPRTPNRRGYLHG